MDQFQQIGEVLGSIKALMVFQDDIKFNQRQCRLLLDMYTCAYESISEEMRNSLKFEEKQTKWKIIEQPLEELHMIFKEGELYIKQILETRDFWAKAITLYQDQQCIEFHIHNLLSCVAVVIEAIEFAAENSGSAYDEMQNRKKIILMKYQKELIDAKLFEWKFGKRYLVSNELCGRLASAWKEDRWILHRKIREKRDFSSKHERQSINLLLKNMDGSDSANAKLLPSSILVNTKDYQVRRRLGSEGQYKEIQWLGESFALRHIFEDIGPLVHQISSELCLSHPNIVHMLCGFTDEEKKECFLVMELMTRDLSSYIKETRGRRKQIPFSLSVAVDLMLQIARGMEYLHSKNIYHGNLNPSNVLVKPRETTIKGYLHARVSGFGLSSSISFTQKTPSFIWQAPEILEEQEQSTSTGDSKYTEKSDVYSFGMICFELLTGKVLFEDGHLQGDKVSRNIRSGERPLFPFPSPKYLTRLTKRCWHADPNQRPSFSSICRMLRYIKKLILLNTEKNLHDTPMPILDFSEIEAKLVKNFPSWRNLDPLPVYEIPFQMFAYRVVELRKATPRHTESSESGSDQTSVYWDENTVADDDFSSPQVSEKKPSSSPEITNKKPSIRRSSNLSITKEPETPKRLFLRPPKISPRGKHMRIKSESHLEILSPKPRNCSGHVSDSDLP